MAHHIRDSCARSAAHYFHYLDGHHAVNDHFQWVAGSIDEHASGGKITFNVIFIVNE